MTGPALLSGPPLRGAETLADHQGRLGALPPAGSRTLAELERSGLRGRGGAGFPAATKWRAVADGRGPRVVLVNGAEGEPLSTKDRLLMSVRPHLVLDGAVVAARTVGADSVVLYLGEEHHAARAAMEAALRARAGSDGVAFDVVVAPPRYVAGEESAAVHCVNDGVALPTALPPRPFQRGVRGRPTLVQNVETLAHAALIARFGAGWFTGLGRDGAPGTTLLTLCGAVDRPGVVEVPCGVHLGEVLAGAGAREDARALLVGGYFGGWVDAAAAGGLAVDSQALRAAGHALGCGVVAVLPRSECGVAQTARILAWLADQSARQCGPCVFGMRAVAECWGRVASMTTTSADMLAVGRWMSELAGRGACRHPDGAANLARSALAVFRDDVVSHVDHRRCHRDLGGEAAA